MGETPFSTSRSRTKRDLELKVRELEAKLEKLSLELESERSSDHHEDFYPESHSVSSSKRRYPKGFEDYLERKRTEPSSSSRGTLPKGFDNPTPEQEPVIEKQGGIKVKHLIGIGIMAMIAIVAATVIFIPAADTQQSNIIDNPTPIAPTVGIDYSMNGIAKNYPNIQDFVKAVDSGALDYDKLPSAAKITYDKQRGNP